MTLFAPRRFQMAGILTLLVACQHDAIAPADSPVVVESFGDAHASVVQEPATADGLVTFVVRVSAHDYAISSFQGSVNFTPGSFELVSKNTPNENGAAFMVNTESFADGRVGFAAFTSQTFTGIGDGVEAFRFTVRTVRPIAESHVDAALEVIGTDAGTAIRAVRAPRNYAGLTAPSVSSVCAANTHVWGDTNGDDVVSVPDAQQIARYTSGLSVVNEDVLKERGDVNADGLVDIIDAQQIARYSIGLVAAARVNATMPLLAASLTVTPGPLGVRVGMETQLSAVPRDGTSADLSACVTTTWFSSDNAVAQVDATGRVVGVATGNATITVSAGGKSAQIALNVSENGPHTVSQKFPGVGTRK